MSFTLFKIPKATGVLEARFPPINSLLFQDNFYLEFGLYYYYLGML